MFRVFLFAVSVMVSSTSTAGNDSPCPVDTVPIQIVNEIRSGPETTLSAAKLSDTNPGFRTFVTAVAEHVAARLGREKLCLDNADSKKRSLLQFVNWPLNISDAKPLFAVPPLDVGSANGCRISSPWIDLVFERKPVPWIRAVVRWNQRQLLADQAVLAGARNVPMGLVTPPTQSEYIRYSLDYTRSEIKGSRPPTATPIEERVPPDILWLFRQSWQSTLAPFIDSASSAMENLMEARAERHTNLVIALIDRCFASDEADVRYSSILDTADLISLEQYKINTPIR